MQEKKTYPEIIIDDLQNTIDFLVTAEAYMDGKRIPIHSVDRLHVYVAIQRLRRLIEEIDHEEMQKHLEHD